MKRLLLPALVALPVLAVLVFLGTWQMQRLHWKTALLGRDRRRRGRARRAAFGRSATLGEGRRNRTAGSWAGSAAGP
jgi:hypothetical protein